MENYYGGPKGLQGIQGGQGDQGFNFAIHDIIENSDISNLNEVLSFVPQLISTASYEDNNWTVYYFSKLGISYCYAKDKNDEIHKIFLGYQHSGFWDDNLLYGEKIDISFKNFEDPEVYSYPSKLQVDENDNSGMWENPIEISSDGSWIFNFKLLNPLHNVQNNNYLSVDGTDTYYSEIFDNSINGKIEGQGGISSIGWHFEDSPIIVSNFYFKNINTNTIENLGAKLSSWKSEWKKETGFYSLDIMEQSLEKLQDDPQTLILKTMTEGIYSIKSSNFSFYVGQKDLKIGFLYTDNTKDLTPILNINFNFISNINKKVKAIIVNSQKFNGYFKCSGNIQVYQMSYKEEKDLIKFSTLENSLQENGNINFNFTDMVEKRQNEILKKLQIKLEKYGAKWDVDINPEIDDVNNDGKVDKNDARRLQRYLEGYDVYVNPKTLEWANTQAIRYDLILDYTINNLNKKIKLLNKYNQNLLTPSNLKVDKKGDYCLNVFNKQMEGWMQVNTLSDNNVYYYEKGDSPTREVTFSLACQDDYFKVNDYDPPFNIIETYTAVIGSELSNAAMGSSILNDILGINENHNCYGFEITIDGVDTIFTLNGSTQIDVAWNDALGPSSIVEKSWNGVTFWVTRAQ